MQWPYTEEICNYLAKCLSFKAKSRDWEALIQMLTSLEFYLRFQRLEVKLKDHDPVAKAIPYLSFKDLMSDQIFGQLAILQQCEGGTDIYLSKLYSLYKVILDSQITAETFSS
jgi:hypothetical protein